MVCMQRGGMECDATGRAGKRWGACDARRYRPTDMQWGVLGRERLHVEGEAAR